MNRGDQLVWLAAPAALAVAAVPAAAQVYLTESQALAVVLGEGVVARRQEKRLSDAERRRLQESSGLRFAEASYTFFVGERQGKVSGFALVLDEIGKSEPITFMIGLSPEGKVADVAVMAFRESRGWEVKEKRFLRQFRGKTLADPIRINQDILNYTGATLSSKAIARGVKRALLLFDVFYPAELRRQAPPPSGRLAVPEPPAPVADAGTGEVALYRQTRCRMGTLCEIRLWSRSPAEAASAFAAGFAELARIERVFSNYRDDGELARVNRCAADEPVEVSAEFWELTCFARRAWRDSRGAFDVTVGPLVKAWGFWQGTPRVPTLSEWTVARARTGADKLLLDPRARAVRFLRRGMELDFGGLAKGYAAGRAARLAQKEGVLATLVNLGGSSLSAAGAPRWATAAAHASREAGLPLGGWPVGVASPVESGRFALYVVLEPGWALSTSGTYEQQFQAGERSFSHLIDPRTGWPVEGLRSATTLARSGRRAESAAKHLLLESGAGQGRRLLRTEWALVESLEGPPLRVQRNLRRTSVLVPVLG